MNHSLPNKIHRLLKRQLSKISIYSNESLNQSEQLIEMVNETYLQHDRERRLLENALEATSQELTGVNKQLELFIENAPTGIAMLDRHLRYMYASRRWIQDRRLDGIDITGKDHYGLNPNISKEWIEIHNRCLLGESASCDEDRIIFADGTVGWIRWEIKPWMTADGVVGGLIIFSENITERKSAENELRIASVAFQSKDGMVVTDVGGNILRINEAFSRLFGYSINDVLGRNASILKSSSHHDSSFYRNMWEAITTEGRWEGGIWDADSNGKNIPVWLSISAVKDEQGLISNYVGIYSNTSDPREAEKKILELAYYDPLTNLPNRRLLLDRLNQARLGAARNKVFGAILLIDIDKFKVINDTRGHDVGDHLLMAVAQCLRGSLRKMDTAARLGGDEFVILLSDLGADSAHAFSAVNLIAEKLHASISEPLNFKGININITSSIGITFFSHESDKSVNELLKEADLALYQAKFHGRNMTCFFDEEMQVEFMTKVNLEIDLKKALDNNQFTLFYQPQVNHEGNVVGAEALLRWLTPNGDDILPDVFIPIAEESGLIIPLGEWALQKACHQLLDWSKNEFTNALSLAINISYHQFMRPDFVEKVKATINNSGANPALLKLELTEGLLLSDKDLVINKINELKTVGIQFSIDDFGTGYSSLNYLRRLPLDEIKIDRSFMIDFSWDDADRAIIRSIIYIGTSLGLRVVAEGVESIEQRDFLYSEGCSFYQGYLFGKPVSADNFQLLVQDMR